MIFFSSDDSQNILFKTKSFDSTVKITDFGLSKDVNATDADQSFSTTTTQAGTEIASFGFYAPEVLRREKQTAKVDIFSLGCCIFYLLSGGHRPHEAPQQPTNKHGLTANIWAGKFDLTKIVVHLPEAAHMISHMIASKNESRPTVQWLLDWHCYFWSERKRFEFLCAVGNEDDRNAVLPPSMCSSVVGSSSNGGWRKCLDGLVWDEYTSDSKYRQHYDCNSISHLLRFMRNASQHTKADSAASAVYESVGGMERYFLQRFPRVLLAVWGAVMRAGWGRHKRSEFETYLPSDITVPAPLSSSSTAAANQTTADDISLPSEANLWSEQQVAEWLASIGPAFVAYGASFIENGIDGSELMDKGFGEDELDDNKVEKKSHRKRILREIEKLR